jgi:signal transduction histidine kinase
MPTVVARSDPPGWFGRLQRTYMASGDESVLAEAADLGRLMAVMDIAVESVIEVHGDVLVEALAAAPHADAGRLVAAADTILSELILACRLASQTTAPDDVSMRSHGQLRPADDVASEYVRFHRGGVMDGDPPDDLYRWLDRRLGPGISLAARAAVQQCRVAMFDASTAIGGSPMRLIVCPFHDGGGVIAIRDVRYLVEARERGFQRRKLESVGQVASGLAHELGNLLQPILSMAQMVREDFPDDPNVTEAMGIILDSTRRAAELVRSMLLYVRRSPKVPQQLWLAEALVNSADAARRALPASIRLELQIGDAEGRVAADPDELGQIIKNLVNNAMHATVGPGVVTIELDEIHVADALAVRMRIAAGGYARLTVSDTGPGIAPGLFEQVFEPFYTTKGIGEGTGLGLSVVQGIVRSWGGSITARNLPERGAAFEILLPLVHVPIVADDRDRTDAAIRPVPAAIDSFAERNGQRTPLADRRT